MNRVIFVVAPPDCGAHEYANDRESIASGTALLDTQKRKLGDNDLVPALTGLFEKRVKTVLLIPLSPDPFHIKNSADFVIGKKKEIGFDQLGALFFKVSSEEYRKILEERKMLSPRTMDYYMMQYIRFNHGAYVIEGDTSPFDFIDYKVYGDLVGLTSQMKKEMERIDNLYR